MARQDTGAGFWRTHGALGVIVAACGLTGVLVPLLLARGGDSQAPAPTPAPEEAATPVVEATAEPETAADVATELELLDRRAVTAGASSTLAPDAAGNRYDPALAIDGDPAGPGAGRPHGLRARRRRRRVRR